jgi:hypothetical protein
LAYIPENVMICDNDYINKLEGRKALEIPLIKKYLTSIMTRKKDIKRTFLTCMESIQFNPF